ncbi:baseplate hub domain-containing protein [Aminobacter aminovorans]|uniref:Phage protein (TIGR02218 family) n=1 Tax=Aminobacter aminovorans TaxID=83263 RepID=A0AAC8YN04_AMIAI|nr:DUF2163 domain-containing protein [Aminobacter aminovorans]AMS41153.1 hypothetical protein AA2016_2224 [Aminobacter aminovorans]MBB3705866.1 putative phage protein (TIGR02218 family) [Aminobacter aminovorans]
MRTLSGGFQTSIAPGATTLGWLLSITFANGTVKRFNSFGTREFSFGGFTWYGFPGFQVSSLTETNGSEAPTVDIERGLSGQGLITFTEAVTGLVEGRPADLIIVDFISGASHRPASKWRVGTIQTTREGQASFELVSLERRNRQVVLKRFKTGCQWKLGDAGCGVDLAPFTEAVTVVSSADPYTIVLSGTTQADDYFNLGAILFNTGQNTGLAYDIRDWVLSSNTLKLAAPLRRPLTGGDTASIRPGCDGTAGAAGCGRYSNKARRFAFDHLPDGTVSVPAEPEAAAAAGTDGSTSNNSFGGWD